MRECASALAEEQRRETLADQGVLEWITQTAGQIKNNTSSVLLLQKEKESLVAEYKKQRETVDSLKSELQSSISSHTSLAEQPNQSESVLQVCLHSYDNTEVFIAVLLLSWAVSLIILFVRFIVPVVKVTFKISQESLSKIHKLRDQLKSGNEKLRDLKKGVKEAQDKLKVCASRSLWDLFSWSFMLLWYLNFEYKKHDTFSAILSLTIN